MVRFQQQQCSVHNSYHYQGVSGSVESLRPHYSSCFIQSVLFYRDNPTRLCTIVTAQGLCLSGPEPITFRFAMPATTPLHPQWKGLWKVKSQVSHSHF